MKTAASILESARTLPRPQSAESSKKAWTAEDWAAYRDRKDEEAHSEAIEVAIRNLPATYVADMGKAAVFKFDSTLPFVTLSGPVGSGKTTAAVAMLAKHARASTIFPVMVNAALWAAEAGGFRFDAVEYKAFIESWTRKPLVLLDDLGTDTQSQISHSDPHQFALASLYLLLEARGTKGRRTIITTNWKPDEWDTKLSERISGRLKRHGVIYEIG